MVFHSLLGGGVHDILKFYRAHEENLNHNSIAKVNHRKTSSSLKKKKKKNQRYTWQDLMPYP
jgi:hypothetical protein